MPVPAPDIRPSSHLNDARRSTERERCGIKKLIDLSRRNNLLFYMDLQAGTLDLSGAPVVSKNCLGAALS